MILNITRKGKAQSSRVTLINDKVRIDDVDKIIEIPVDKFDEFLSRIQETCERNNEVFEVIGKL